MRKSTAQYVLLAVFICILLPECVTNNSINRHCADPESFPGLEWENYAQLLEQQSRTLLFGAEVDRSAHAHNTTRQQVYVSDDATNTNAICKSRFIFNSDNFRKPEKLMEQTCQREIVVLNRKLYVCRPVVMYVNVLRRGNSCRRGTMEYNWVWEKLHVGCATYSVSDNVIEQTNAQLYADA